MGIDFTEDSILDFRERIRKMTDAKLIEYGKAAAYMADPKKSSADRKTLNYVAIAQLRECRAEWRRRHPASGRGNFDA